MQNAQALIRRRFKRQLQQQQKKEEEERRREKLLQEKPKQPEICCQCKITTTTTSNKTTTKTVTVSGGGRADDFENLRMSFTPLDTSTQRERISVSRSGTMGIRRPPTRRHTPAALICSSPEDGPEIQRPEDGQILVDSDDNLRDTPDPDPGKMSEQSGISIVGFKNISPKIRVGFPVEIQLELQTKLRSSSTLEIDHKLDTGDLTDDTEFERKVVDERPPVVQNLNQKPIPLLGLSSRDSSYELSSRRKSFLSENLDSSSTKENNQNGLSTTRSSPLRRSNLHQFSNSTSNISNISNNSSSIKQNQRNSISSFLNQSSGNVDRSSGISWDLIQGMRQNKGMSHNSAEKRNAVYSTLSSGTSSGDEQYIQSPWKFIDDIGYDSNSNLNNSRYEDSQNQNQESFTHRLRNISNNNTNKKTVVTLNASSHESLGFEQHEQRKSSKKSYEIPIRHVHSHDNLDNQKQQQQQPYVEIVELEEDTTTEQVKNDTTYRYEEEEEEEEIEIGHVTSTPDVLHHDNSSANSLSPSLERSRKLLKMLDETPDLLNKMSFRSYFANPEKQPTQEREEVEEKDEMDWETQRQLSFLNDSLSRILDETRNMVKHSELDKSNGHSHGHGHPDKSKSGGATTTSALWRKMVHQENEVDLNGNFKEVSKTWICSVDHGLSQTVRDNDVVTSISATNDAFKKQQGPKKVEFCKTEVHFTPDSGRFNIVETDENKPSTAHLFRRKKRSERKQQQQQTTASLSIPSSSSSSMSSLDSNPEKSESPYVLEMQVSSAKKSTCEIVDSLLKSESEKKTSTTVHIENRQQQEQQHSIPTLTSATGDKLHSKNGYDDGHGSGSNHHHRVLINLENVTNHHINHMDDYNNDDEAIRSPSHNILSNYGEMKIQRYLKQLKSNSNSRESSSSPMGSPTPNENDEDGHFRFDNILYENGSFVPLATRRSLIEMNNRNRKRQNGVASHSSDNSSTTSTYSLPTSDKDPYGTLRLGTMEATVSTSGSHPQITAVEFHYTHDNNSNKQLHHHHSQHSEEEEKSEMEYHNLSVKERRERFSSVPSPVMPNNTLYSNGHSRRSMAVTPTESVASDIPTRPTSSSSTFMSKKPPTPILPLQFSAYEKTGAELRERFYSKNTDTASNSNTNSNSCVCITSDNDVSEATIKPSLRPSSTSHHRREDGKLASKSIVTIGGDSNHIGETQEMTVTSATINTASENDPISPEPVLSLDHTWKGPAHFESQQDSVSVASSSTTQKKAVTASRSLTFPKSVRAAEPEWVSKAKSRETRVTDWSLIEKQQQQSSSSNRNTEPPWISELRFRNKPAPNDELKSLPKISVVYPWQRGDGGSKEPSEERTLEPSSPPPAPPPEEKESHILSIIPEPLSLSMSTSSLSKEESKSSRYVSHDLYSGKSSLPLKSLKSVPEVSLSNRKSNSNKSIVEVHSEPEHYISSPSKYHHHHHQTNKSEASSSTISRSEKNKSVASASSMRIISEGVESDSHISGTNSRDSVISRNSNKRDTETLRKSRKSLQSSKETLLSRDSRRKEKEIESLKSSQNQPRPPKPPHSSSTNRATSLSRGEYSSSGRDSTLMAIPPFREATTSGHHRQHRDKMSGTASSVSHTSRKPGSRARKAEVEEPTMTSSSRDNTPVHHRHPTIQISKLPMRTAKVAVVDGNKRHAGGSSTGSKSKPKHHAASTLTSKGESSKPTSRSESESKSSSERKSQDAPATTTSKTTTTQSSRGILCKEGKVRSSQSPLKSCTRPPSSELEMKKRKTTSSREQSKRS